MLTEVEIIISGRVQGVGFRYSAYHKAIDLDLKGYVKNLPDGNVFIVAQGNSHHISVFMEWCKIGPPVARVNEVNVSHRNPGNYESFSIR